MSVIRNYFIFIPLVLFLLTSCESTFVVGSPSGKLSLDSVGVDNYLQTSSLSRTKISGTCTEDEVTLSVNNQKQDLVCRNKKFSTVLNLQTLSDGDVKISVTEIDNGKSETVSTTVIKDTVPPSTALVISGMGAAFSNSYSPRNIKFTPTSDDHVVKYVNITSGTCASASFASADKALAGVSHSIRLRANSRNTLCAIGADRAGNWGTVVASSANVVIDTRVPELKFSFSRIEIESGTTYQVNWKLSEANPDAAENMTLEYSETGTAPWTILDQQTVGSVALANQSYSFSWSSPSIQLSSGKIRLRLKDLTGQEGVTEAPLILDNMSPTLNTLVLANGAPVVGISNIPVALTVTKSLSEITEMRFSEDSLMTGSTWAPYSAQSLQNIIQLNGPHTIYAQVRSGSGQTSNILNATIDLEHGNPPDVTILAPVRGDSYGPGQTKTISWSCTTASSYGLATNPVSITYTVDDGLSNHPIASNLASAVGTYSWTLPSVTPSGQIVSINKPMRINVYCKAASGVVSNALSALLNSSWDILIGEPGNIQENVHINVADITGLSFHASSDGTLFYNKQNSLMRMNPGTGIVNQWAGSRGFEGCTLTHGGAGLVTAPAVLDINENDEMLIYSELCSRLYKIRISDKRILWSKSFPHVMIGYFVNHSKQLFYVANYAVYSLDITSSSGAPKLITGTPGSCGTPLPIDSEARLSPLPCGTTSNYTVLTNKAASKMWVHSSSSSPLYIQLELDETTGNYIRKDSSITSGNLSRCVAIPSYDEKLFCYGSGPGVTGRSVTYFDLESGTRGAAHSISTFNNINTTQFYTGKSKNSLYVNSSTNELFEVRYEGNTWSSKKIGGTAFHIYGNGTDSSKVALTSVAALAYDTVNKWLYTRGTQHLRRFHINDTDPMDIHIDNIQSAFNSTQIANSGPNFGLAVNKTGDRIAGTNFGGTASNWAGMQLSTWNSVANTITKGTSPNYLVSTSTAAGFPTLTDTMVVNNQPLKLRGNLYQFGTFLTDGNFYFLGSSDSIETFDVRIFKSNGTNITSLAGADGAAGYSAGDDGELALGSRLSRIHGMQDDGAGDLLIFDGHRLRKITAGTESATPRMYDVTDFSQLANYPGDLTWSHALHDPATGWSYFALGEDQSINRPARVWAARPAEGFVLLDTTGIVLTQATARSLYLEKTPLGLLLLDGAKKRIIRTDLKN